MSDYRRVRVSGGCYFFTVVTHQRRPLFGDAHHIGLLRQGLAWTKARRPFAIDAIVILPDHLHCVWRLPEGDADFSGRWRAIKQFVSKRIDTPLTKRGEKLIWQRRFWEHLIRDEEDWRRHVDYIHFNPVKHGFAPAPRDWPYSSFARAVEKGWYASDWGMTEPEALRNMICE